MATRLNVTVNGASFTATLGDSEAAQAFAARLPATNSMSELNGNEKYMYLDESLPTAAEAVGNIQAGDIMLFESDCLVLFYKSFLTGYRYTRLGHLDNSVGLVEAAGRGTATVTWELV